MSGALEGERESDRGYEGVRVPALFVHGDVPRSSERVLDSLVAHDARFARAHVDGAHALPHVERPFETAQALRTFHRSLSVKPQLRVIRGDRPGPVNDLRRRAHSSSQRHA
jgi:hypothetical protein